MSAAPSTSSPPRIDYDGRRFSPAGHRAPEPPPVGHYHQDGELVWAEFSGAGVRAGYLVGTCDQDGVIAATYCLVTAEGAAAGSFISEPTVLADGRIRLCERWRRMDGTSGVSYLEECPR